MTLSAGITARLILIRHGEPSTSATGRCYGKLDVGLSEKGRSQIKKTGEFVKKLELAAIYASPRKRASESAKIIARESRNSVDVREDFAEMDFGDFEGRTYESLERDFPEVFRKWMETPTEVEFPNGEGFAAMQERVLAATDEVLKKHGGETVGIVSHGGVNRIVLAHFLRMANADIFRLAQDYACVNIINFFGDFPLVKVFNYSGNSFE